MKERHNVLVVSGGKWVGMVRQLKQAMSTVRQLRGGKLIVADMCENAPAGVFADEFAAVPPIGDPDYIDALLELCESRLVRVLVPLIDLDLDRLSPYLESFLGIGTSVVCPDESVVQMCLDKAEFRRLAQECNLPVPKYVEPNELSRASYPLFHKPKRGFGSQRCGICTSHAEARSVLEMHSDMLFQEYVRAPELSVDGFVSRTGHPIVCVPRMRDKVVGGEAYQSHTVELPEIHGLALKTMRALADCGFSGPLNIQMFLASPPCLIEVNTRLGSASVLADVAVDGRLLSSVLEEACGGTAYGNPSHYRRNVSMFRYLGEVFFHEGAIVAVNPGGAQRD